MAGLIPHSRTIAVVDIGAGYVGCALVALKQSGASSVIAQGRSLLSLDERTDKQVRARVAAEIAQAVQAVLSAAGEAIVGKHIAEVRVILHAPWASSQISTVREEYEKRTLVQRVQLSSLAQKSVTEAESEGERHFERSVLSFKLNGYPTSRPEGKFARTVQLSAIMSVCDPTLKKNIDAALHAAFPSARFSWLSAEHMYTEVLRHLDFPADALIVDVGVQATHLVVLQEGVPRAYRVVTEGLRSILDRVHGTIAREEALSLFRMLSRDACESQACDALRQKVASAEPQLVKLFGESLAALAEARRLPNTLALVAHPDIAPWLASFFERIDFAQFTLTTMPLAHRPVEPARYASYLHSDDTLDLALTLACVHTAIEQQST